MSKFRNLHPVDELADVNAQLAFLKARKEELRGMILAGECAPRGDTHVAVVSEVVSERLDAVALRKAFGDRELAPWLRQIRSQRVDLRRIEGRGDA